MEKVPRTLAGRTAVLHLLPLSLAELGSRPSLAPDALGRALPRVGAPPAQRLWPMIWAGFFPRIHDKKLPPDAWLAD